MNNPSKQSERPLTAQQAREAGFTIDTHCYPWVAYKGDRFAPKCKVVFILTDTEATLLEACEKFCAKIATAGEGVRFSEEARELVMSSVDDFQAAIALATKTEGGGM